METRNVNSDLSVRWYALAVVQWMKQNNSGDSSGEYLNDIPNTTKGAIFQLECSYQKVNQIILAGKSPVNLVYVCQYGKMYTEFNALKLTVGHVLRDVNGVKVKRMEDGLFKPFTSELLYRFIQTSLYQKAVSLLKSIFGERIVEKSDKIEQQAYISDPEEFIISFPKDADTRTQILNMVASVIVSFDLKETDFDPSERDSMFANAALLIVRTRMASTSLLQRELKLGYERASRIIDQLEAAGIIGGYEGSRARAVKVANEMELTHFLEDINIPTIYNYKDEMSDSNIYKFFVDNSAMLSSNKSAIRNFYEENKLVIEQKIFEIKQLERDELQKEIDRQEKEIIKAKLLGSERKRRLSREAREELMEKGLLFNKYSSKQKSRETIPQEIMDQVWNRDGGKCVGCGSQESLEFDHIIPHSKGGAATYRNLQILCKACNLRKSNKIG